MTLLLYDISRNDVMEQKTSMLTPIYKTIQCNWDKGIASKCEVQKVMLGPGESGIWIQWSLKKRQTYKIMSGSFAKNCS